MCVPGRGSGGADVVTDSGADTMQWIIDEAGRSGLRHKRWQAAQFAADLGKSLDLYASQKFQEFARAHDEGTAHRAAWERAQIELDAVLMTLVKLSEEST